MGMLLIDHILDLMTSEELDRLNKQWATGKVPRLLAAKMGSEEMVKQSKGRFYLNKVAGEVKLTKTITLAPLFVEFNSSKVIKSRM